MYMLILFHPTVYIRTYVLWRTSKTAYVHTYVCTHKPVISMCICCMPQTISATQTDNILRHAALEQEVYDLAIRAMNSFTQGQLKGQKPPSEYLHAQNNPQLSQKSKVQVQRVQCP